MTDASLEWARSEFGTADLGDTRRTARLVAMGAAACERPSGKVAAVFGTDREREGAYDFLESEHVDAEEVMASVAAATMRRITDEAFVFVPVDGTSITVTDKGGERDFGSIGPHFRGARGLKIIDALAVDPEGVVIGWLALTFWARSPKTQTKPAKARRLEEKETHHWTDTIRAASAILDEHGKRGWFQLDREADGIDVLSALHDTKHWWTVRGNRDRTIEVEEGGQDTLRTQLATRSVLETYDLKVTARPGRAARVARMVVRVAQRVVLRMRDARTGRLTRLTVNVVWACEEGTTPSDEDPIDWFLLTNRTVETAADAQLVLYGYEQRWRVEECHRTWKRGDCDIESTQLHSFEAVRRWAIILGAVATRIERLKGLARRTPTASASVELTSFEIEALRLLRSDVYGAVPAHPTIAEAVRWLAELGGWTNKYSGKPPGAVVLGRALRVLRPAARLLAIQGARDQAIP